MKLVCRVFRHMFVEMSRHVNVPMDGVGLPPGSVARDYRIWECARCGQLMEKGVVPLAEDDGVLALASLEREIRSVEDSALWAAG